MKRTEYFTKGAGFMSKRIITINRMFGSNGRIIGKDLAEELGFKFYDKEQEKEVQA